MDSPVYQFVCPSGVLIEEGYAAVGFKYRLPGRRVHITTSGNGVYLVMRRRRKNDEALGQSKTLTAMVDASRFFVDTHLRLSMDALKCVAHFLSHIEASDEQSLLPMPQVLTRKIE